MPQIILANVDSATMAPNSNNLSDDFLRVSATVAKRMTWAAESGDILLLPSEVNPDFVRYVETVKSIEPGSIRIVPITMEGHLPHPISVADMRKPELLMELKAAINNGSEQWTILPFIADSAVAELQAILGLPIRFSKNGENSLTEAGDVLNDKRVYRALAAGLSVPIAEGRVCQSEDELSAVMSHLLSITGSVIVKLDRHSGSDGNIIVTRCDLRHGAGATKIISIKDDKETHKAAAEIYAELAGDTTPFLIVEAYYRNKKTFGVYYDLSEGAVQFVGVAELRMAPLYKGMIWPSNLKDGLCHEVMSAGHRLARAAFDLGHRGPFSVDGVITECGQVIFCEVNGRHGGFSCIWTILDHLFEAPQTGNRVAMTTARQSTEQPLQLVLDTLSTAGILFDQTKDRGVIVTVDGVPDANIFDLLFIGNDRAEVEALEIECLEILERIDGSATDGRRLAESA